MNLTLAQNVSGVKEVGEPETRRLSLVYLNVTAMFTEIIPDACKATLQAVMHREFRWLAREAIIALLTWVMLNALEYCMAKISL